MCYSKLLAALCGLAVSAALFAGDYPRTLIVDAAPQVSKGEQPRVDLWGDPLPVGALARFGTLRYRSEERITGGHIGILANSKTVVIGVPGSHRLQLVDASTGKVVREISTGDIAIQNITVLSNGESIAVIGQLPEKEDGTRHAVIGIVDVASGKMSQIHEKLVTTLGLVGDRATVTLDAKLFVSTTPAGLLAIHEVATGAELQRHQFPRGSLPALAVSADGSMVAFTPGSNSRQLFLWKWKDPGEPREIKVPVRAGRFLTFSPDGKTIAECPDLNTGVRIWDVASGQLVHELVPPDEDRYVLCSAAFTPDGKTIIVAFQGSDSSSIHCWNAATGKHQHRLPGPVGKVVVSPNSKLLVATGGGGFRAWEIGTWKEMSESADGHHLNVTHLAFKHDLVASADDRGIRVWDTSTGKQRLAVAQDGRRLNDIALSPDGTKLGFAGNNDGVFLWDITTEKMIYNLAGHGRLGGRETVGFTADGKFFLSYGRDNFLRQWDVATGKAVLEHKIQPKGVKLAEDESNRGIFDPGSLLMRLGLGTFSPDGSLFVLDTTNEFHIFDVSGGKEIFQIVKEAVTARALAVSPDGRSLLVNMPGKNVTKKLPDGTIMVFSDKSDSLSVWELATRQVRKKIGFPEGGIGPVVFSPDGKRFAVAINGANRRVHIYDMAGGKEIAVIEGYRGTVHSLAFADDGQRLATGMSDTTVLLWDVAAFKK